MPVHFLYISVSLLLKSEGTKEGNMKNINFTLKQFNKNDYFELYKSDARKIKLTIKSVKLLISYYQKKYGANIATVLGSVDKFAKNCSTYLRDARKQVGDYRKAFIVMDGVHATLIFYFSKKMVKKPFLLQIHLGSDKIKNQAKYIQIHTGISVDMVDDARQFDLFSCYTDALVLACLVTGINPAPTVNISLLI